MNIEPHYGGFRVQQGDLTWVEVGEAHQMRRAARSAIASPKPRNGDRGPGESSQLLTPFAFAHIEHIPKTANLRRGSQIIHMPTRFSVPTEMPPQSGAQTARAAGAPQVNVIPHGEGKSPQLANRQNGRLIQVQPEGIRSGLRWEGGNNFGQHGKKIFLKRYEGQKNSLFFSKNSVNSVSPFNLIDFSTQEIHQVEASLHPC